MNVKLTQVLTERNNSSVSNCKVLDTTKYFYFTAEFHLYEILERGGSRKENRIIEKSPPPPPHARINILYIRV